MLTHEQARKFYDRLGARQDWQRFYEDDAVNELITASGFDTAASVIEFGCGTGRFAERLLQEQIPGSATYLGLDSSTTMINLAQKRLARFRGRAEVRQTAGEMTVDVAPARYDRFVSVYVLDLLDNDDISAIIREAHRVLVSNGLLCLVSLTHGYTTMGRVVEKMWTAVHNFRPVLVGGCRPVSLDQFLEGSQWMIRHLSQVSNLGLTSQVVVAEKVSGDSPCR